MSVGRCQSCGASIRWETSTKGRPMPLDSLPRPDGNVGIILGRAHVLGQTSDYQGDRFTAHHMTCPHGLSWRRARL